MTGGGAIFIFIYNLWGRGTI